MHGCLSTASISVLFNWKPYKPFKMGRGLRQGDPLSPFLFVLIGEVLNKMMIKAKDMGFCKGLQVGRRNIQVSHLQFADDTLTLCEANEQYLQNIKRILLSFYSFSGLEVNYDESGIIALGEEDSWAQSIAAKLGCQVVQLPFTYLDVPLGANMRKYPSWRPIIDKV